VNLEVDDFESFINALELKCGRYATGLFLSVQLLLITFLYVTPSSGSVNFGVNYSRLSLNPLDFSRSEPLQNRILGPLVGHLIYLRGEHFVFLPILAGLLFLTLVYAYYRRDGFDVIDSLGMMCLMAFTTPVLFTLHFQGYTDTVSYLLILLCIINTETIYWYILFALALLNHESNIFALPYLLWLAIYRKHTWKERGMVAIMSILSLIPMLAYQHWVSTNAKVLFSSDYYLNLGAIYNNVASIFDLMPIGIFMAFKLLWLLPIMAFTYLLREKNYCQALWFILVPTLACGQLLIARDTSRLMGLAFPCILCGAKVMRDQVGKDLFKRKLWILIGLNLLVPTYYVGSGSMVPFWPLPVTAMMLIGGRL